MTDRIDSLMIRCRGDDLNERAAQRVRQRLERIAATYLPRALDTLLPSIDLEVGRVIAPLDFAIGDHDDETVAWRWASAIAGAVAEHQNVATGRPAPSDTSEHRTHPEAAPEPTAKLAPGKLTEEQLDLPALVASAPGILSWIDELSPSLRSDALAFVHDFVARRSKRRTETDTASSAELARTDAVGERVDADDDPVEKRYEAQPALSEARNTAGLAQALAVLADDELVGLAAELDDLVGGRSGRTPRSSPRTSDTQFTQSAVGGLVLLYPWLGRLIERAFITLGREPEHGAAVLATLLNPTPSEPHDPRRLAHDPLVKVLVGLDSDVPLDPAVLADADVNAVRDDIDEVLDRFAAAVRGSWTAETLISQLVWRDAALRDDGDVWTVIPAAGPLDHLLLTLPYPLGAFAFEWTRPIAVRWAHQ